jgi:hypothetical protein
MILRKRGVLDLSCTDTPRHVAFTLDIFPSLGLSVKSVDCPTIPYFSIRGGRLIPALQGAKVFLLWSTQGFLIVTIESSLPLPRHERL